MSRFLSYAILLAASVPLVCPAADETASDRRHRGTVRLLSVADDLPIHYKTGPRGESIPTFAGADEEPPSLVYVKVQEKYEPVPLLKNSVSPVFNADKKVKIEGYYIQAVGATDGAADYASSREAKGAPAAKAPAAKEPAADKPLWATLAKAAPVDGKDYLLCIFQPDTRVKWYLPKTRLIDISPSELPMGSCLLVNLSDRDVVIQLGVGKQPVRLVPGASAQAAPDNPGAPLSIKMAAKGKTVDSIMFNRERVIPVGERAVFVAYSAYNKNSRNPVLACFCPLKEPVPEPVPVAPAKASAR